MGPVNESGIVDVLVVETVHFLIKNIATKFGFHRALLTTVTLELKITEVQIFSCDTNKNCPLRMVQLITTKRHLTETCCSLCHYHQDYCQLIIIINQLCDVSLSYELVSLTRRWRFFALGNCLQCHSTTCRRY
jgi:hypothetical protein